MRDVKTKVVCLPLVKKVFFTHEHVQTRQHQHRREIKETRTQPNTLKHMLDVCVEVMNQINNLLHFGFCAVYYFRVTVEIRRAVDYATNCEQKFLKLNAAINQTFFSTISMHYNHTMKLFYLLKLNFGH